MAVGVTTRVAFATAGVVLLVGCSGVDDGSSAQTTVSGGVDQVRLDPAVDLDVDGRRVAARCGGKGPSVLLVSGYGTGMAESWDPVQAQIATFARVCAYDRLGVGDSGPPPRSQTFDDMAQTLDGVVSALDLTRPVVLVAHSLGGMVATTWAAEHPDDVAGLLLVDATGPGYPQRLLELLPRSGTSAGAEVRNGFEDLLRPARNAERLDGRVAFDDVEQLPLLGGVPMVVLTHSIVDVGADVRPRQAANLESAWEAGQNRWLGLSSEARLERVDLAGHFIQRDQPQVVVDRARELAGG